MYLGLRALLWTYRILGRAAFSMMLYPVISYFFLTNREKRRASRTFLFRVASFERGRSAVGGMPSWRHVYRHFLRFGEATLDKFLAWTGGVDVQDLDMDNEEAFEDLRRNGRGGLLIASHLGNAEVCRAIGTYSKGLRINVLVHTKHAENFNRLMREECPESPVLLLQTTEIGPGTAMMLRARIMRGEFVVIAGDRVPVSGDTWTAEAHFLDVPALFPTGPYILAAILGCPVLLLFCLREGSRYRVVFEEFADRVEFPRRSRQKVIEQLVARYAARLEYHCLRYPYQWFNFYDFWSSSARLNHKSDVEPNRKLRQNASQ